MVITRLLTVLTFFCCLQAAYALDAASGDPSPDDTLRLLERAQHERGQRAPLLQQAHQQIALGLKRSRLDPVQRAKWLRVKWYYLLLIDDHRQARQILEEALELLTGTEPDPRQIAGIRDDLSYSLILLGHVADAKDQLRRAIVIAGTHQLELLPYLYYNIGDAYRKTGERSIARSYFEAALESFGHQGDEFGSMIAFLKLGSLAREDGDHTLAIDTHQSALAYFRAHKRYRELVVEIELARDYLAYGDRNTALQYAQSAWDDDRALAEQRLDAGLLLLEIANDMTEAGNTSAANKPEADRLITEIERNFVIAAGNKPVGRSRPMRQLKFAVEAIRHYVANDDYASVKRVGENGIRLVDQIGNELQQSNEDFFAWIAEAQPFVTSYVHALYRLHRSEVLALLESQNRWRSRAGAIRASNVVSSAIESQEIQRLERYLETERRLVNATTEVAGRRLAGDEPGEVAQRKARLAALKLEHDKARDLYLASRNDRFVSTSVTSESAPATPSERPVVPDTDLVLRYFVQDKISFVAALSASRLEYFELPSRPVVRELVTDAFAKVKNRHADGGERIEALSALASLLPLDFLAQHDSVRRLVIIPDDAVHLVPFSAIDIAPISGSRAYSALTERYEVVRTHSITGYYSEPNISTDNNQIQARVDIAIFADPVFGFDEGEIANSGRAALSAWAEQLDDLPYTALEAKNIAETFAFLRVETYLGQAATREVLMTPAVRSAKVLHIATHGYFSEDTPGIVGLATSSSVGPNARRTGFLSLSELLGNEFSSKLVIVSGCETMRGKEYSGLGVKSVAQGFLARGAGSAVGTLWKVPDHSAAVFMRHFYQSLRDNGGNTSTALRTAKLAMTKSRRYWDPVHWAGFVLDSSKWSVDRQVL